MRTGGIANELSEEWGRKKDVVQKKEEMIILGERTIGMAAEGKGRCKRRYWGARGEDIGDGKYVKHPKGMRE